MAGSNSSDIIANNGHSVRGMHFDSSLGRIVADDPAGQSASGAPNNSGGGDNEPAFEPSIGSNLTAGDPLFGAGEKALLGQFEENRFGFDQTIDVPRYAPKKEGINPETGEPYLDTGVIEGYDQKSVSEVLTGRARDQLFKPLRGEYMGLEQDAISAGLFRSGKLLGAKGEELKTASELFTQYQTDLAIEQAKRFTQDKQKAIDQAMSGGATQAGIGLKRDESDLAFNQWLADTKFKGDEIGLRTAETYGREIESVVAQDDVLGKKAGDPGYNPEFDADGDGTVTMADITALITDGVIELDPNNPGMINIFGDRPTQRAREFETEAGFQRVDRTGRIYDPDHPDADPETGYVETLDSRRIDVEAAQAQAAQDRDHYQNIIDSTTGILSLVSTLGWGDDLKDLVTNLFEGFGGLFNPVDGPGTDTPPPGGGGTMVPGGHNYDGGPRLDASGRWYDKDGKQVNADGTPYEGGETPPDDHPPDLNVPQGYSFPGISDLSAADRLGTSLTDFDPTTGLNADGWKMKEVIDGETVVYQGPNNQQYSVKYTEDGKVHTSHTDSRGKVTNTVRKPGEGTSPGNQTTHGYNSEWNKSMRKQLKVLALSDFGIRFTHTREGQGVWDLDNVLDAAGRTIGDISTMIGTKVLSATMQSQGIPAFIADPVSAFITNGLNQGHFAGLGDDRVKEILKRWSDNPETITADDMWLLNHSMINAGRPVSGSGAQEGVTGDKSWREGWNAMRSRPSSETTMGWNNMWAGTTASVQTAWLTEHQDTVIDNGKFYEEAIKLSQGINRLDYRGGTIYNKDEFGEYTSQAREMFDYMYFELIDKHEGDMEKVFDSMTTKGILSEVDFSEIQLDHLKSLIGQGPASENFDSADFAEFSSDYHASQNQSTFSNTFDFDASGVIDFADFVEFAGNFGGPALPAPVDNPDPNDGEDEEGGGTSSYRLKKPAPGSDAWIEAGETDGNFQLDAETGEYIKDPDGTLTWDGDQKKFVETSAFQPPPPGDGVGSQPPTPGDGSGSQPPTPGAGTPDLRLRISEGALDLDEGDHRRNPLFDGTDLVRNPDTGDLNVLEWITQTTLTDIQNIVFGMGGSDSAEEFKELVIDAALERWLRNHKISDDPPSAAPSAAPSDLAVTELGATTEPGAPFQPDPVDTGGPPTPEDVTAFETPDPNNKDAPDWWSVSPSGTFSTQTMHVTPNPDGSTTDNLDRTKDEIEGLVVGLRGVGWDDNAIWQYFGENGYSYEAVRQAFLGRHVAATTTSGDTFQGRVSDGVVTDVTGPRRPPSDVGSIDTYVEEYFANEPGTDSTTFYDASGKPAVTVRHHWTGGKFDEVVTDPHDPYAVDPRRGQVGVVNEYMSRVASRPGYEPWQGIEINEEPPPLPRHDLDGNLIPNFKADRQSLQGLVGASINDHNRPTSVNRYKAWGPFLDMDEDGVISGEDIIRATGGARLATGLKNPDWDRDASYEQNIETAMVNSTPKPPISPGHAVTIGTPGTGGRSEPFRSGSLQQQVADALFDGTTLNVTEVNKYVTASVLEGIANEVYGVGGSSDYEDFRRKVVNAALAEWVRQPENQGA